MPILNNDTLSPWIAEGVNPYGYRVNIQNPYINSLYRRCCKAKGIPPWCPLSDEERMEFELAVIPHLEKRFNRKAPAPNIPPRVRDRLSVQTLKRIYGVKGMEIVKDIKK